MYLYLVVVYCLILGYKINSFFRTITPENKKKKKRVSTVYAFGVIATTVSLGFYILVVRSPVDFVFSFRYCLVLFLSLAWCSEHAPYSPPCTVRNTGRLQYGDQLGGQMKKHLKIIWRIRCNIWCVKIFYELLMCYFTVMSKYFSKV